MKAGAAWQWHVSDWKSTSTCSNHVPDMSRQCTSGLKSGALGNRNGPSQIIFISVVGLCDVRQVGGIVAWRRRVAVAGCRSSPSWLGFYFGIGLSNGRSVSLVGWRQSERGDRVSVFGLGSDAGRLAAGRRHEARQRVTRADPAQVSALVGREVLVPLMKTTLFNDLLRGVVAFTWKIDFGFRTPLMHT